MIGQSEINKHEKKSYYDHDPEKKQNRFGPLWSSNIGITKSKYKITLYKILEESLKWNYKTDQETRDWEFMK